ncbi:Y+L amino acid transporter 2-like [Haliotis cracherodii]|uniref:Y+L amino acid transporter 2-like n=1 Tax=Haliotis cracherodii TaxID=6455 RepID=UPI0039E818AE
MTDTPTPKVATTLKKQFGLVSATSYITGSIIGTGIFISPTVILEGMGSSVGLSLLVWMLSAAVSFCGAMCYAEYGTRVKKSGGTYTYIREGFGDLAGFIYLWTNLVLLRPLSVALSVLACAEYVMRPVFLTCPDLAPTTTKVMLGFLVAGLFVVGNLYSVRLAANTQTIVTVCKVTALSVVIVTGIIHLVQGNTENFNGAFKTINFKPGGVVLAFYAGLFGYTGWDATNAAVEEVIKPYRNIPIAVFVGLAIPTLIYVLANVAYHAVLTNDEILSGIAVAYVFGERTLGVFKWVILACVAMSAGGNANSNIFIFSRINFVGGRDGLFPRFLSMINVRRRTPQPSIIALFILTTVFMCLGDVKSVLGAYVFFRVGGECLAVSGFFFIRRKHAAADTTYKTHWVFPGIYVVSIVMLSVTAVVDDPGKFLPPFVIILMSVPLYYMSRSRWWKRLHLTTVNKRITLICHRLLLCEHASQRIE